MKNVEVGDQLEITGFKNGWSEQGVKVGDIFEVVETPPWIKEIHIRKENGLVTSLSGILKWRKVED